MGAAGSSCRRSRLGRQNEPHGEVSACSIGKFNHKKLLLNYNHFPAGNMMLVISVLGVAAERGWTEFALQNKIKSDTKSFRLCSSPL